MRFVCTTLLSLVAVNCLNADTITLKDGSVVQAPISRYEKGKFTVEQEGKSRIIRTSDIESVDFDGVASESAPAVPAAAGKPVQQRVDPRAAAVQKLEGDELEAWKLARSHIATNKEYWMPDNAMPIRDAIQVTATGDYAVAIPVASKPEPGLGQNYGIFYVQVTKFETAFRVDGDNFQQTNGPFRPAMPKPQRKAK